MLLYTAQGYDLRSFGGHIDLEYGTYRNEIKIKNAQRRLYELLISEGHIDSDQLVWCAQSPSSLRGRFLNTIEVQTAEIDLVIDELRWCWIIYDRYCLPQNVKRELWWKAADSLCGDKKAEFERLKQEFLSSNVPSDLWSAGLYRNQIEKSTDQILLRFPLVGCQVREVVCLESVVDWAQKPL